MRPHFPRHNVIHLLCSLTLWFALAGCSSENDPVQPADKLCVNGAGLAARVSETPIPIEVCIPDGALSTELGATETDRYDLAGAFTVQDITIEMRISFLKHLVLSTPLNLTSDITLSDVDDVWFFYREIKEAEYDYTSTGVSGSFTLVLGDDAVVTATFSSLEILLMDTATNADAGTRTIGEGFINASVDN